ncbi:MAG: CAAD domain-containing protein [Cyanobacteria bacterium P01_F01_bin.150]
MESKTTQDFSSTSTPNSGVITKMSSSEEESTTFEDLQKTSQQIQTFIADFSGFAGTFWTENKALITAIGFSVGLIVLLKILLAVLGAINDLPLLAPTFEFIGILYVGWFTFRYLLNSKSRQELGDNINAVKSQVLGSSETVLERLSSDDD